jgi:arylsulfatase A-like enzyme
MDHLSFSPWIRGAALLLLGGAGLLPAGCDGPSGPAEDVQDSLSVLGRAAPDAPQTNLLFVLVDTLRADRLGGYGYSRSTSPFLDQLARNGVSFRRVLSPSSWTKPAVASLFTASYPARHGVLRANDALTAAARLPAEVFRDAGYGTAGVVGNHWLSQRFGFEQGFEAYQRFTRDYVMRQRKTDADSGASGHWVDRDITESALEFLRGAGARPFFLYLHYMGVHNYASDPAPPHFGGAESDRYDNAVAELDREVAKLVAALEELGLRSTTLVVVTSDHGESLSERGFDGHGFSLYAQEVQVPLLLSPPLPLDPARVVQLPVSSIDIFPTLYEILGVEAPTELGGRSLLPLIRSGLDAAGAATPVFSHLDRRWSDLGREPEPIAAVQAGRHYYVRDLNDPTRAELFDTLSDPAQRESLAGSAGPDITNPLRRHLRRYSSLAQDDRGSAEQVELGHEILKELEQLGYVIGE